MSNDRNISLKKHDRTTHIYNVSVRQQTGDARLVASADWYSMPVLHQDKRLTFKGIGSNLLHELQIHNRGTMNTDKGSWVTPAFEIRHGLAQKVALFLRADANIILLRAN